VEEIKKRYRELVRSHHPDVSKEKDAAEKFKKISAAYEELMKTKKEGDQPQTHHGRHRRAGPFWFTEEMRQRAREARSDFAKVKRETDESRELWEKREEEFRKGGGSRCPHTHSSHGRSSAASSQRPQGGGPTETPAGDHTAWRNGEDPAGKAGEGPSRQMREEMEAREWQEKIERLWRETETQRRHDAWDRGHVSTQRETHSPGTEGAPQSRSPGGASSIPPPPSSPESVWEEQDRRARKFFLFVQLPFFVLLPLWLYWKFGASGRWAKGVSSGTSGKTETRQRCEEDGGEKG